MKSKNFENYRLVKTSEPMSGVSDIEIGIVFPESVVILLTIYLGLKSAQIVDYFWNKYGKH